jgi:cytoskeletal protein CcmA (bactofilin family)
MGAQQRRGVGRLMFGRRAPAPPREGLVIGPDDRVHGTVAAQAVTVAGQFDGRLTAETTLAVLNTGRVTGTFFATKLVIDPGAVVRATVRVGLAKEEEHAAFPEPPVVETAADKSGAKRERDRKPSEAPPLGTGLGW